MRLGVFSDIHGNAEALSLVLGAMAAHSPDGYVFLGDLCGYYYEPLDAWRQMESLPNFMGVLGNHDRMFLDILAGNEKLRREYLRKYGRAMECLLEREHGALADWLRGLPEKIEDRSQRFVACHGSPQAPLDGYIYPDTEAPGACPPGWMLLTGHTHYRMHRVIDGAVLVNPGSVGQPRDGSMPSWCMVDTESMDVEFFCVPFVTDGLRRKVRAMGEANPYLEQVLLRQKGTY